ncbi:hypothetical protein BFP72_04020 [Reichenbachiella sp. 5M10]|uniref:acyltransferase family protein n=1 Tax=Reichenbachiella sp. 5M10 TaxID=1889772 RepID=UPI000C6472D0|nr:hypothetical protein BFP72_04020 [Reichenbachiella sp. 5M10]
MDEKQNYLAELHSFRGLAILLIVASHILYADLESSSYGVLRIVFLNSTIFFAFISGYLFQHLLGRYEYAKYLTKKAKFVILPYLLVSIPAIGIRWAGGPSYMALYHWPTIGDSPFALQVVYYLGTGAHLLPLWYIPMIALYFLGAPLFKFIDERRGYGILPLLFILSFCLPRDPYNINEIFVMAGHFLSVYVLGMFYSRYRAVVDVYVFKHIYSLIAVFVLFTGLSYMDWQYASQVVFVQKILCIPVLIFLLRNIRSRWIHRPLQYLADTSFGIYFIHFYVVLGVRYLSLYYLHTEYPSTIWMWCVSFIGVMVISFLIVCIVQLVFRKYSRWLIGS